MMTELRRPLAFLGAALLLALGAWTWRAGVATDPASARARDAEDGSAIASVSSTEVSLTEEQEKALDVKVVVARLRRGDHPLVTTGKVGLDLDHTARLRPLASSVIHEVLKHPGDTVAKDEPLFVLESTDLGDAKNAYRTARATLELAARTYAREARLREGRATTEVDFQQAASTFRASAIAVDAALQRCLLLGVRPEELEGLDETLPDGGSKEASSVTEEIRRVLARSPSAAEGRTRARYTLRAPLAGVLIAKEAARGELVDPSQVVATVSDLDQVWVAADIYQRDLARVRVGAAVEVTTPGAPCVSLPGRVTFLSETVDEATRTLKARIVVANSKRLFKAGLAVKVAIHCEDDAECIELPPEAIVREGERPFVIVRAGAGRYVRRAVTLGLEARDAVHVLEGVAAGEAVVTAGNVFVHTRIPLGD